MARSQLSFCNLSLFSRYLPLWILSLLLSSPLLSLFSRSLSLLTALILTHPTSKTNLSSSSSFSSCDCSHTRTSLSIYQRIWAWNLWKLKSSRKLFQFQTWIVSNLDRSVTGRLLRIELFECCQCKTCWFICIVVVGILSLLISCLWECWSGIWSLRIQS